jgi:hypothetical protein
MLFYSLVGLEQSVKRRLTPQLAVVPISIRLSLPPIPIFRTKRPDITESNDLLLLPSTFLLVLAYFIFHSLLRCLIKRLACQLVR